MIAHNPITSTSAPTVTVEIYIGGTLERCAEVLAERAAIVGACWSIEPIEFVYSGGRESGVVVRSINYPRFPSDPEALMRDACDLARHLILNLHQSSCSVVGPIETVFFSRRGTE
jgi:hypothetical protein